jgi:hypothetical protein
MHALDGEENPVAAPVDPKLIEDLEAANRILADQGCSTPSVTSASGTTATPDAT